MSADLIDWKPCERHCYTSSLHVMAACPDCETPGLTPEQRTFIRQAVAEREPLPARPLPIDEEVKP